MAPKILILGAGGLVGSELVARSAARGFEPVGLTRADCDITLPESLTRAFAGQTFAAVVNCAAYNAVDRAEAEPEVARLVNAVAAGNVAAAARAVSTAILHYSTDFVFDGERETPYLETDPPNPLSAYARSKALGDAAVARENPRHFILRVGCLYGAHGKGFGSTLIPRFRAGERVRADGERRIQPTWAGAVTEETLALLEAARVRAAEDCRFGLFHAMCHGETTWAGFAVELARLGGFDPRLVDAVATRSLGAPAQRPRYAVLENRALQAIGLDRMPAWQAALQGYLAEALGPGGQSP